MFSGGDRVLRRGAERWERVAREQRDGAAVLADGSVAPRVGGALVVLGGVALGWIAVLHLRRPVRR